jgi:hypothetical protein
MSELIHAATEPVIEAIDVEGALREERPLPSMPPEQMPAAPHGGVSDEAGDHYTNSYSTGVKASVGNNGMGRLTRADGTTVEVQEYGFGNPRKSQQVADGSERVNRLDDRVFKGVAPAPTIQQATTPHQQRNSAEQIADHLWDNGISTINFFISSSLPQGQQWMFDGPMVMMVNALDYSKVLTYLHVKLQSLEAPAVGGFVGESEKLMSDPTFGPLIAMTGMFHVEQPVVDETIE